METHLQKFQSTTRHIRYVLEMLREQVTRAEAYRNMEKPDADDTAQYEKVFEMLVNAQSLLAADALLTPEDVARQAEENGVAEEWETKLARRKDQVLVLAKMAENRLSRTVGEHGIQKLNIAVTTLSGLLSFLRDDPNFDAETAMWAVHSQTAYPAELIARDIRDINATTKTFGINRTENGGS